jgi:hypothetical protein
MRPKKKEHLPPHARKISSVAKLIMVMNSLSKNPAQLEPQRTKKINSIMDIPKE